jgi:mono/diheme cytochrome c family protein
MFSKSVAISLAVILVLGAFSLAFALGGGNYRKGKYLFRKNCRSCHAEGQTAKDLSPINFTQKEWTQVFTDKNTKCQDEWSKLKDKDLNDIYTYMYKHAKDSPTPAKCK